jgi:hypothetical protein
MKSPTDNTEIDELTQRFKQLPIESRQLFFRNIGIEPCGWLYAYEIPLHSVRVVIQRLDRHNEVMYRYTSNDTDWCLVNMGYTAKRNVNKRLNYFHYFHKEIRPTKSEHMIYCINADTSWEDEFRNVCRLGGWDIGGKTAHKLGYFTTEKDWRAFLGTGSLSCGPTECAVIPRATCQWLRTAELPEYPRTAEMCAIIKQRIRQDTLALLMSPDMKGGEEEFLRITRRDCTISLQLQSGEVKVMPFDNTQYEWM